MTTLGGPFQLQNLPTVSSGGSGGGKKKSNRPKKPKGDGSGKKKSYVVKTHRENLDMSSEEEEEEEEYKKGGYHPVEIGNVFNSRIKVTAKLGWGHFSTVWLATDSVTSKTVALKVVKSAQHYTEAARDEIKILQKLTQEDPSNESCVIHLLDHFEVCGINGNHVAMVFEKLGCNLLTMIRMYKYKGLPVPLVRMMAKQILVGVEFLHRCDVIHTDLKPENLLLVKTPTIIRSIKEKDAKSGNTEKPERAERAERAEVPVRDNSDANDHMDGTWENPEISEIPEIPEKMEETELQKSGSTPSSDSMEPMSLANSLPTLCAPTEKVVSTASSRDGLPWSNEELLETFGDCYQIKIVDLGNACWTFKHFTDDVQTRQYRAPEVILGAKYDTAIDVWSVACIVFELLSGDLLFEPKADKNYDKNDDHLAQIQELLGRMPKQVALNGKHSRDFFNRHGELRYLKDLKYWSLKDVLHEKYKFSETEAKEISLFLSPMLNMSARDRATAKQMLDHPWLKGVDVNLLKTAFWE